mmetsp:Transcript_13344/g.53275  ORF Transcript_13344/g.53275 Transcript_13344/m.53275 type:complete len:211 (+) Transcript_13344:3093-3725(+)
MKDIDCGHRLRRLRRKSELQREVGHYARRGTNSLRAHRYGLGRGRVIHSNIGGIRFFRFKRYLRTFRRGLLLQFYHPGRGCIVFNLKPGSCSSYQTVAQTDSLDNARTHVFFALLKSEQVFLKSRQGILQLKLSELGIQRFQLQQGPQDSFKLIDTFFLQEPLNILVHGHICRIFLIANDVDEVDVGRITIRLEVNADKECFSVDRQFWN